MAAATTPTHLLRPGPDSEPSDTARSNRPAVPMGDPAAISRRASTARLPTVFATTVGPGLLLVLPALDGSDAIVTVGLVLTEVIALYAGYGTLTRIAGPTVHELLASG